MDTKTPGVKHAMVGQPGSIKQWLQIVDGPRSRVSNPALLANMAGMMAQIAMQQSMAEITDYLASIEQKVDDVLRAQKDAVVADMIGVDLVVEEAMTIREARGRVDEVTWSKIQATPATIARTQAYALRQLDALAEKLERQRKIGDLAKAAKEAESKGREWLAVLAHCFRLQDAVAVLELDRVLDSSPHDLDQHRLGLRAARQNRLQLISRCTDRVTARMIAAASTANTKVLLHPSTSPAVVQSSSDGIASIADFHGRLEIERGRASVEARRWVDAAALLRDNARARGTEGLDTTKRVGNEALDRTRAASGKLVNGVARRLPHPNGVGKAPKEDE